MFRFQSILAILLCQAVTVSAFGQTQSYTLNTGTGFVAGLTRPFRPHPVADVNFTDSDRVGKLIRAGVIYLSLRDAIALALENNLDLEVARYYPKLALSDLQRASAGQLLRNVSTSIASGPTSASLSVLAGATQVNSAGSGSVSGSTGGVLSGLSVQLAGAAIPNTEPYAFVSGGYTHSTNIETSTLYTGTLSLVQDYKNLVYGVQEGFWTGTTVQFGLSSVFGYNQNAPSAQFNPIDSGQLSFSVTQNLLNGFGLTVNKRALNKAQNNLKANDLSFKQQVISTVSNVVNLYWDLVTFNDDLRIKRSTFDLDSKLYEDNKRRADLGAIAPIDIIQAEAEMKAAEQDVVNQESQELQQEAILKSVITRNGLDNMAIALARVVPTDHIAVPDQEPVTPIQDLVSDAIGHRVEVEQNQITLANARLDMLGTKSNLLPSLSVTAGLSNSGEAGAVNPNYLVPSTFSPTGQILTYRPATNADVNNYLLGGYGGVLGQIFRRNFPNYNVSFSLSVPLRNRANQADQITAELNYRQAQIQDKELHNNVKLSVMNAWTALRSARAAYETAVVARRLQDETLTGTRRKYELGTATILDVVIAQRDATTRELAEADQRDQYQRARTNLQQNLGTTLEAYDVNLDEAKTGTVAREPDLVIPPAR